ncbi:hypothetical protein ACLB2K_072340 [Fragaria x ananassa]
MWDITIHPPWESDALIGTLTPHGRVALIPLSHPMTHSTVTRYCPLWTHRPSRFCFQQLRSSFPVGHPSWDCSSINMLNLGVPIPSEAAEPPKGLVLDWRCSFPVGHPSWDCSSINMLNLGVPIPFEAAEPPKGLAKILKKYDKRTGALLRLPFIQEILEQPFFTSDLISKLVKECEGTINTVFPVEEEERKIEVREAMTVTGEEYLETQL